MLAILVLAASIAVCKHAEMLRAQRRELAAVTARVQERLRELEDRHAATLEVLTTAETRAVRYEKAVDACKRRSMLASLLRNRDVACSTVRTRAQRLLQQDAHSSRKSTHDQSPHL